MMKFLVVEDDPLMAATLKHLIELNPFYTVVATSDDLLSTLEAVAQQVPDLALVDLKLARDTQGLDVAARLHGMDIPCLLTTGSPPTAPVPGVALGCLAKPFDENSLMHALMEAEDIVRGRQKLVRISRLPEELELYADDDGSAQAAAPAPIVAEAIAAETIAVDAFDDDILVLDEPDDRIDTSLLGRILATVRMPLQARHKAAA